MIGIFTPVIDSSKQRLTLRIYHQIPLASALPNVPESYRPDGSLANPRDASGGGALQSLLAGTTKAGLAAARKLLGAGDAADVETAARELWQAAPTADNVPVLSLALASVAAHRGLAAADYSAALAVETMVLSAAAGDADFISQLVDMVALLPQGQWSRECLDLTNFLTPRLCSGDRRKQRQEAQPANSVQVSGAAIRVSVDSKWTGQPVHCRWTDLATRFCSGFCAAMRLSLVDSSWPKCWPMQCTVR